MGGMIDPIGKPPILVKLDDFLNTRHRTLIQRFIADLERVKDETDVNARALALANVGRTMST